MYNSSTNTQFGTLTWSPFCFIKGLYHDSICFCDSAGYWFHPHWSLAFQYQIIVSSIDYACDFNDIHESWDQCPQFKDVSYYNMSIIGTTQVTQPTNMPSDSPSSEPTHAPSTTTSTGIETSSTSFTSTSESGGSGKNSNNNNNNNNNSESSLADNVAITLIICVTLIIIASLIGATVYYSIVAKTAISRTNEQSLNMEQWWYGIFWNEENLKY